MRDTELAWAAGFFDGEGCSSLSLRSKRWLRMRLTVGQVDLRPLARFKRAVSAGHISRSRTCYQWGVEGFDTVQGVLTKLWPYLSAPKREQATRCLRQMRTYKRRLQHA